MVVHFCEIVQIPFNLASSLSLANKILCLSLSTLHVFMSYVHNYWETAVGNNRPHKNKERLSNFLRQLRGEKVGMVYFLKSDGKFSMEKVGVGARRSILIQVAGSKQSHESVWVTCCCHGSHWLDMCDISNTFLKFGWSACSEVQFLAVFCWSRNGRLVLDHDQLQFCILLCSAFRNLWLPSSETGTKSALPLLLFDHWR